MATTTTTEAPTISTTWEVLTLDQRPGEGRKFIGQDAADTLADRIANRDGAACVRNIRTGASYTVSTY